MPARPLDEDLKAAIIAELKAIGTEEGLKQNRVARAVGVTSATISNAIRQGRVGDTVLAGVLAYRGITREQLLQKHGRASSYAPTATIPDSQAKTNGTSSPAKSPAGVRRIDPMAVFAQVIADFAWDHRLSTAQRDDITRELAEWLMSTKRPNVPAHVWTDVIRERELAALE